MNENRKGSKNKTIKIMKYHHNRMTVIYIGFFRKKISIVLTDRGTEAKA